MTKQSTTTSALLRRIRNVLMPLYKTREAESIATLVVEHIWSIPRVEQLLNKNVSIDRQQQQKLEGIEQRLLNHEPIQYILGYANFYGRNFKVDTRALIPRPETEELVDWVLKEGLSGHSSVLDLGTGSGCLGITLALHSNCRIYAVDVDPGALELAAENARLMKAPVELILGDVLDESLELPRVHVILCNPPYIPWSDRESISLQVKGFEPSKALFVPDSDPMLFYRVLSQRAPGWLHPRGQLYMEIYHQFGQEVKELFSQPQWSQVTLKKDLQGRDRMVRATRS